MAYVSLRQRRQRANKIAKLGPGREERLLIELGRQMAEDILSGRTIFEVANSYRVKAETVYRAIREHLTLKPQ